MERIKPSQIKGVRDTLLKQQGYKCPLCESSIGKASSKKRPALDHDHTTGIIRDVLCINCNGLEGKIWNLLRRMSKGKGKEVLANLLTYYDRHEDKPHGDILHSTHKTEVEKRDLRNKRARLKRANLKKVK